MFCQIERDGFLAERVEGEATAGNELEGAEGVLT